MVLPIPPPSKSDKRILAASVIIFLASIVIVILVIVTRTTPRQTTPDGPATLAIDSNPQSPQIIAQLTALPSAVPLTGPLADEVHAVAQMVSNCSDYSQTRRDEMNQHIEWLLQPNTLPKEVIIALGTNTNGRLIFGMATYTLAEWGGKKKAPDSWNN